MDSFGTGANRFEIDFVMISGDASSANGTFIGDDKPEGFIDPGHDYRMGKYEITNDQWNKFQAEYGTVTGYPLDAYNESSTWTGTNIPVNEVSWYEAAQFVNWLNTSTGHQAAYKFTGTQGTSDYTFTVWDATDTGYDANNPYRNSNAFYFLPTEDEWVKAAYWNGINLQTYPNASSEDLISGKPAPTKWNYKSSAGDEPWIVGSGSKELNGTYDMMGNVWEWNESLHLPCQAFPRGVRGGSFGYYGDIRYSDIYWRSFAHGPTCELDVIGFRVASRP